MSSASGRVGSAPTGGTPRRGGPARAAPADPRVTALVERLVAHSPASAHEHAALRRMLGLLRWLSRPFDRGADPTHVTASAIVLDEAGRVLLHRHRRLGTWLQPGGHVEGLETPAAAAARETAEETGVVASHPRAGAHLVHVDVHEGPLAHVHLDLRYRLHARGWRDAGESTEVAWMDFGEALARVDASLAAALRRVADTGAGRAVTRGSGRASP